MRDMLYIYVWRILNVMYEQYEPILKILMCYSDVEMFM